MDYKDLLKNDRLNTSSSKRANLTEETESDRGRVIYSKAFRRLQQKTQVFPLEGNAAVRVRLTHSLEVAHLGKLIAAKILIELSSLNQLKEFGLEGIDEQNAFVNTVEVACLLHDIGNPPFGHFGEKAIQEWFRKKGLDTFVTSINEQRVLDNQKLKKGLQTITKLDNNYKSDGELQHFIDFMMPDFLKFDGNPQGLRIITRLQWNINKFGLNLLCSQILAYLKYTKVAYQSLGKEKFEKKPGYFYSEKGVVDIVRKQLKLSANERFPLAYIMEAADDIAYCLSDIEDGLEKNLISADYFRQMIRKEWREVVKQLNRKDKKYKLGKNDTDYFTGILKESEKPDRREQDLEGFFHFKIAITQNLINFAVEQFIINHKEILRSTYKQGLLDIESKENAILKTLKSFSSKYLYSQKQAEDIELAGYRVITGLLDWFEPLLKLPRADFEDIIKGLSESRDERCTFELEKRLFHMLPKKHLRVYKDAIQELNHIKSRKKSTVSKGFNYDLSEARNFGDCYEWFFRAHLIVDYISGMTDSFALEKYQLYTGINLK